MPGYAMYKNGKDIRVYIADAKALTDKERKQWKKQKLDEQYSCCSFRGYSHSES